MANSNFIPDSGSTLFPLDEGGYNAGTLNERESGVITFDVVINDDSDLIINWSYIRSDRIRKGTPMTWESPWLGIWMNITVG